MEIKKAAKQGNKQACAVLAKQLVNLRKQKVRLYGASATISSVNAQTKSMVANKSTAEAMGRTAKAMGAMNKQMDPQKVMKTMQQFQVESSKMEMKEELMDDVLDDILGGSDEEEEDAIVNQVLDEIGIEVSGKLADAPGYKGALPSKVSESQAKDKALEEQLARLMRE
nr:charged multivesicular body protein 2b-like [Lytechinus pictus]